MELAGLPTGIGLVSVLLHPPHRHSTGKDRLHFTKHPNALVTSRLNHFATGKETAPYAYFAESDAIQTFTFKFDGTTRLTKTRSSDTSDRLNVSGVHSTVKRGLLRRIHKCHRLQIYDTYKIRQPSAVLLQCGL